MADFELKHPGGQLPLPVAAADRGPVRPRGRRPAQGDGLRHARPGLRQHRVVHVGDHLHRRRRGHPALPRATRSTSSPRSRRSSRSPTCSSTASCRPPAELEAFTHTDPQPHAAARGPAPVLRRLPARRAPDGRAVLGGQRAVDLLPGQPRPVRPRARRDLDGPADGQAPDDRVVRLQEGGRPAAALPRQLARLRRELPADDLRRAGHAVRGRPDDGAGARHAVRAARRPRAELLDLHRAAGRLQQRQPVRVGLGRRQRAVRPAARRRQPGRARDARRASTRTAATSTRSCAGSRTRSPASS